MGAIETLIFVHKATEVITSIVLMSPFIGMGITAVLAVALPDPEFTEWDKDKHK